MSGTSLAASTLDQRRVAVQSSTRSVGTVIGAAALVCGLSLARAQTPPAAPSPQPVPAVETPAEHLQNAKRILDSLSPNALSGDALQNLAALRQHFATLAGQVAN